MSFEKTIGARLVDKSLPLPSEWQNILFQPNFSHPGSAQKLPQLWTYSGVQLAKATRDELVFTPKSSAREDLAFIRVRKDSKNEKIIVEVFAQWIVMIDLMNPTKSVSVFHQKWTDFFYNWVLRENEADLTDFGLQQKKLHTRLYQENMSTANTHPFDVAYDFLKTRPGHLGREETYFNLAGVAILHGDLKIKDNR